MTHKLKPSVKITIFCIIAILIGAIVYDRTTHQNKSATTTSSSSSSDSTLFSVGGSNTIGDKLAPNLAKAYMLSNGYSDVNIISPSNEERDVIGIKNNKKYKIQFTIKGSSSGFTSLNNNSIDVCMSSTKTTNNIYEEHVIGLDGIGIIVNNKSLIQNLSILDIQNLFSNNTKNVYRMDDNSGTCKVFTDIVMGNKRFSTTSKKYTSITDLINAVNNDPNGIGFVSYAFINNIVKIVSVSINSETESLLPNQSTIQSEKYPLCRRLYFYTNKSINNIALEYIKFTESDEGQKIVSDNQFINLNINVIEPTKTSSNDPIEYTNLNNGYEQISTEFRFELGKQTLDSRGNIDVGRLKEYIKNHKGKNIILVGFTDNIGSPANNKLLSIQRANTVQNILKSNGINISNTIGLGSAHPVRGNNTEEDRANNRRVEVWIQK